MDTISSSEFIYENIPESERVFTHITELPSYGFNILVKAKRFGKWFLLKGLKEEYRKNPIYQNILLKEFEIMANLSHPSVVSVFSLEDVSPYGTCIVMEYIDGESLVQFMLHPQSVEQRLRVFYNILDAMRYIHAHQVTHRDLKPSNILVTHNNRNVKIIDFGLSDTDYFAILKEPAGTRKYMSPEQQSSNTPDVRNDIYSLGIILMNLQLGKSYQGVVKRCVAPIEQRYANIDQLEKALQSVANRKKRQWMIVLTVITMILATLIVWQGVLIRNLSDERMLSADSIKAMNNLIRKTNQLHNEKLKLQNETITKISDSLAQVNSFRQKWNEQNEHEQLYNQSIANGKKEVDRYIQTLQIAQYLDTFSSINYLNEKYYKKIGTIWDRVKELRKKLDSKLTEDERAQIEYLLNNYATEQYVRKWEDRINKIYKNDESRNQ